MADLPETDHPERTCRRCFGPNVRAWCAPSPLWNAVMRGGSINGVEEFDGIVCPNCFAQLAEQRGIASVWRLSAEQVHVPLETVTPSGRTWDADAWLWREPGDTVAPAVDPASTRSLLMMVAHLAGNLVFGRGGSPLADDEAEATRKALGDWLGDAWRHLGDARELRLRGLPAGELVGMCGSRIPPAARAVEGDVVCELPAGHTGWHGPMPDGPNWTEAAPGASSYHRGLFDGRREVYAHEADHCDLMAAGREAAGEPAISAAVCRQIAMHLRIKLAKLEATDG